jgi:hypothetical protein
VRVGEAGALVETGIERRGCKGEKNAGRGLGGAVETVAAEPAEVALGEAATAAGRLEDLVELLEVGSLERAVGFVSVNGH